MTSLIPLLRIDLANKGLQHLGENSWSRRKPEGKKNEFKESRVPLKSQILVMIRMYGDRKVGIFTINCSKELRTRQGPIECLIPPS